MSKNNRTFLRRIKRRKFGELLLSQGSISPEQLGEALELQKRDGGLLGEIMVQRGFITENEVVRSLSTQYGLPVLRVRDYEIDKEMVSRFAPEFLFVNLMLPLSELSDLLLVTVADLPDNEVIETLEQTSEHESVFYISSATEISDALTNLLAISDDDRERYLSMRRRRGGQRQQPGSSDSPKAEEGPGAASQSPGEPVDVKSENILSDLDNAWESIFDEAEQNIRREGL